MDQPPPPSFPATPDARASLRQTLRRARVEFARSAQAATAAGQLGAHLTELLVRLEARTVGVYWPMDGEFSAVQAIQADDRLDACTLALPYATRSPPHMVYRHWDRGEPDLRDECGIPASSGAALVPEVVLVPCVGYDDAGHRLGYGGGYFDRWLAGHPGVTAVGVSWALGRCSFTPQPHDQPLPIIVTEEGLFTP